MNESDRTPPHGSLPPGGASLAARRASPRLLNSSMWNDGIVRWACRSAPAEEPLDALVAIPARDERDRIETCLDHCFRAITLAGLRVRLLVLVNGTRDGTAERALAWSVRRRCPMTLFDVDFADHLAHAGAARRLAFELASLGAAPETMLLTTDADARPAPGWVVANAAHLRAGAALVCGRIESDPDEACRLPNHVNVIGGFESSYRRATLELERLLDPDPWNPWPHHGMTSGASLAIRVRDLAAVGGVPLVPCGEDKALARRVRAHGLSVVHADDVEVTVSCRTRGRAAGGMADALRQRLHDLDPPCDEMFEPVAALYTRLVARASLRRLWPSRDLRHEALVTLGADAPLAFSLVALDDFERAWARFASAVLDRSHRRLRIGDLRRELPVLRALLDTVRAGSGSVGVAEPVPLLPSGLRPLSPERVSIAAEPSTVLLPAPLDENRS